MIDKQFYTKEGIVLYFSELVDSFEILLDISSSCQCRCVSNVPLKPGFHLTTKTGGLKKDLKYNAFNHLCVCECVAKVHVCMKKMFR